MVAFNVMKILRLVARFVPELDAVFPLVDLFPDRVIFIHHHLRVLASRIVTDFWERGLLLFRWGLSLTTAMQSLRFDRKSGEPKLTAKSIKIYYFIIH